MSGVSELRLFFNVSVAAPSAGNDTFASVTQAQVVRLAAQSGGRVTRDQVYELGGFPDDRMLRGFTRPSARLTAALQAEGVVPERVLPILVARYPEGVKASYFSVPPEIPALYAELSVPQVGPH